MITRLIRNQRNRGHGWSRRTPPRSRKSRGSGPPRRAGREKGDPGRNHSGSRQALCNGEDGGDRADFSHDHAAASAATWLWLALEGYALGIPRAG